eukprot:6940890-Prymnesium_polylepis.1
MIHTGVAATAEGTGAVLQATQTAVDPLALVEGYLQPYQAMLGAKLPPLRGLRGVLCWDDPALTTWLCLLLAAIALLLPLLPWPLICHTSVFLVLGPHMLLVGTRRKRTELAAKEKEAVTKDASQRLMNETDPQKRKEVIEKVYALREEELMKEEKEENDALMQLAHSKHADNRLKLAELSSGAPDAIVVRGSLTTTIKLPCTPCPFRSSVRPMHMAADASA